MPAASGRMMVPPSEGGGRTGLGEKRMVLDPCSGQRISQRPMSNLRAWLCHLEGPRRRGLELGDTGQQKSQAGTMREPSSHQHSPYPCPLGLEPGRELQSLGTCKALSARWRLSIFVWLRAPTGDLATAPPCVVIDIFHGGLRRGNRLK